MINIDLNELPVFQALKARMDVNDTGSFDRLMKDADPQTPLDAFKKLSHYKSEIAHNRITGHNLELLSLSATIAAKAEVMLASLSPEEIATLRTQYIEDRTHNSTADVIRNFMAKHAGDQLAAPTNDDERRRSYGTEFDMLIARVRKNETTHAELTEHWRNEMDAAVNRKSLSDLLYWQIQVNNHTAPKVTGRQQLAELATMPAFAEFTLADLTPEQQARLKQDVIAGLVKDEATTGQVIAMTAEEFESVFASLRRQQRFETLETSWEQQIEASQRSATVPLDRTPDPKLRGGGTITGPQQAVNVRAY